MAKAKKLASGSWRCLVYDYTDEKGKRHYKSFTSNDPTNKGKREAEFLAAQYAKDKKNRTVKEHCTFKQALEQYITSKENILSPATIREYRRAEKKNFATLNDLFVADITQEQIQNFINDFSVNHSPKTVRNTHGLISAVIKSVRPDMALHTTLPQRTKPNLYIPTDDDIKRLLDTVNDEEMMICILLAAFGPMRRSEICGLESTDIVNKVAHVQRAVVLDSNRQWVTKTTKSVAGDRFIPLPDFVFARIKHRKGPIVTITPDIITKRFATILKRAGLPHFRFHDLRHYCASIQHAMGIPDAYIMQRGGWGSDTVLKQVYRHALSDQSKEMNNLANEHFTNLCNTKKG